MALTVIMVQLVIDGDSEHAHEVVENMLDNGAFQDPINQCAEDNDCVPLKVRMAIAIAPTEEQERAALRSVNTLDEINAMPDEDGTGGAL